MNLDVPAELVIQELQQRLVNTEMELINTRAVMQAALAELEELRAPVLQDEAEPEAA